MTALVRLTGFKNQYNRAEDAIDVWVNPERVAYVRPRSSQGASVFFAEDGVLDVVERPDQVLAAFVEVGVTAYDPRRLPAFADDDSPEAVQAWGERMRATTVHPCDRCDRPLARPGEDLCADCQGLCPDCGARGAHEYDCARAVKS